jgi:transposase
MGSSLNHSGTPLTINEAERCLRGSVIMRKICYETFKKLTDSVKNILCSYPSKYSITFS